MAAPPPAAGLPTLVTTKLKVADLLRVCQKCKLPRGGLKADLQARIIAALKGEVLTACTPAQVEAAVRDVYATTHGPPRLLPPVAPRVVAPPPSRDAVHFPPPAGPTTISVRGPALPTHITLDAALTRCVPPCRVWGRYPAGWPKWWLLSNKATRSTSRRPSCLCPSS